MIEPVSQYGGHHSPDVSSATRDREQTPLRGLDFLWTSLPEVYDFAIRLLGSPEEAEAAIEAGLRAILRTPRSGQVSRQRFTAQLLAEVYLVAEAGRTRVPALGPAFSRVERWAAGTVNDDIGALTWSAARLLSLQEYAALHLQTRMGLTRDGIADALGLTPTYAFNLTERAARHFESAFAASVLLRAPAGTCATLESARFSLDARSSSIQQLVSTHLADGCEDCSRYLSRYGEIRTLLGAIAAVPPPPALAARLKQLASDLIVTANVTASPPDETGPVVIDTVAHRYMDVEAQPLATPRDGRRGAGLRFSLPSFLAGCVVTLLVMSAATFLIQRPSADVAVNVEVLGSAPDNPAGARDPASGQSDPATSTPAGTDERPQQSAPASAP